MKQEYEMTPGVLVSGSDMSAGDYKARVAALEDELAELRKRVCVPDASTMARVLSDRAASACCVDPDDNWKIYGQEFIEDVRAMLAVAPARPGQAEPLYITHRPLIHNAINLLGMRRPVAPDVELVINGLRAMLDGMPTPAEPASEHWIAVAQSAAPAPVERNQCDGCQAGIPVESGMHRMGKPGGYPDLMACTADRYGAVPVERLATDGGRNQRFEGLFEGETPDQRDARLAAAAPVERVEQGHDAIALDKARNIMQIMYGEMPKGGSAQLLAMVQVCILEAMSHVRTPQPAPTAAQDVAGLVDRIVPRIDAGGPNPINPDVHCCEWTLHKERERIHAEFAGVLAHQIGGAKP